METYKRADMFKVYWDNDCGYGVDEFDNLLDAGAFMFRCRRYGTHAYIQTKEL